MTKAGTTCWCRVSVTLEDRKLLFTKVMWIASLERGRDGMGSPRGAHLQAARQPRPPPSSTLRSGFHLVAPPRPCQHAQLAPSSPTSRRGPGLLPGAGRGGGPRPP